MEENWQEKDKASILSPKFDATFLYHSTSLFQQQQSRGCNLQTISLLINRINYLLSPLNVRKVVKSANHNLPEPKSRIFLHLRSLNQEVFDIFLKKKKKKKGNDLQTIFMTH